MCNSTLSLTSELGGGVGLTRLPGRFTSEKDPVWTGAENLASTGFRFPDRAACSEALYRVSYPGPF